MTHPALLPKERLRELAALAEKATPGPWGRVGVPYYEYWIVCADEVGGFGHKHPIASIEADNCREGSYYVNTQREANAAFITACSPDTIKALLAHIAASGWQPISSAPNNTDHMRRVLIFWKSRGVTESYWDIDEDFSERPNGWVSPEEGWRGVGDGCIPVNQDDATHWQPLPPSPETEVEEQYTPDVCAELRSAPPANPSADGEG